MDSARWEQIQDVFHRAAELSRAEQRAFLENACADDRELIDEVQSLLEEDSRGSSMLERDVGEVAHRVLDRPLPPQQFGRYRVRELLGEGGMGVVYLAEREDLSSKVAIKVLRDAWLSPARLDRFRSEQRTLAQLNHPSIARLYDADTLPDGTPWFVMEYVEGVSLTEYCRAHNCTIEQRLRLFRAVCDAVQHAHSQAVIHRDLKPSNILVKADGSVRLLDFGIAKQLDRELAADQTRTGLRLMTPAYAAPEQIRGEQVGVQADVYALGVILYELLAGKLPFDLSRSTPAEAETMVATQDPVKPSAIAGAVAGGMWADLDVLCLTAMHKDLERRYRSVEALTRDVDHYLKREPLESRPDSLGYRLGKFVSRHRTAVLATTAAVVAAIALVIFFTVRLAGARNAALAQAARTQRIQAFMLNLFEGGDKETGPAGDLRVVTLIDRGVRQAHDLDNEPAVQAELYETLGSMYQKLGKLDRADSLLRSAMEQHRSLARGGDPHTAQDQVALGLLRVDQAQLEEAERMVREGLELLKRARPADTTAILKATTALGRVLEERGSYDKAIAVLEEAVKAPGAPEAELAAALVELASAHFYAGHYDASDALNQRALAIHRRLHGERHPLVSADLINLGANQYERGRYADAEKYYRQALDITQSFYGDDHYQTAADLTMLSRALYREEHYDEAVEMLQRALKIRERVFGVMNPNVASTLNELGNIAYARNRLDEAEADFQRVLDIYKAVYRDHHYLIGIAISNLGSVNMDRKNYARAEQLFREAIRRFTETLSAEHSNTGIAHLKLGRTFLRQDRYKEAEPETLEGFRILSKQTTPSGAYLKAARKDLRAIYAGLHEPEKARQFEEPGP